ncbi:hypothetical protein F4860DRAFT_522991 [Xylaria cubensis]|nr:hypothetical protein F4860DRAFT_522991 [Xylaria cubensis]
MGNARSRMEHHASDQKSLSKDKSTDLARTHKKHHDEHIDDIGLVYSLHKCTLEATILQYKYLFCTPLYWTHRHEKVLHVRWHHLTGCGWSPPTALLSIASAFPLVDISPAYVASCISVLEKGYGLYCGVHRPMVDLLNALYDGNESSLKPILDALLNDGDKFLRVDTQRVDIVYGDTQYRFLPELSIYRQAIKRSSFAAADDENADEAETFWRMIHLNWTDVCAGARMFPEHGRNFHRYGVAEGMSVHERLYGGPHPYFIPGIFIAMEQRYRLRKWSGQKVEETDEKKDKRAGAHGTPTWQILFTDGPTHHTCAHLYTTQVPGFIVDSLEKPARSRIPALPTYFVDRSTLKVLKEKGGFRFRITHARIPYFPQDTFRKRLRATITFHRDYFETRKKKGKGT